MLLGRLATKSTVGGLTVVDATTVGGGRGGVAGAAVLVAVLIGRVSVAFLVYSERRSAASFMSVTLEFKEAWRLEVMQMGHGKRLIFYSWK